MAISGGKVGNVRVGEKQDRAHQDLTITQRAAVLYS